MATVAERVQQHIGRGHATDMRETRMFLRGPGTAATDITLSTNDYLALSGDRRITAAMSEAMVAPVEPETSPLARRLAHYTHSAAAVVCQSGWAANIGLLQAIAAPGVPIHVGENTHMSWRQAALAAAAPLHTFGQTDPARLAAQIRVHGPGIIAVDAIDSTTGTPSPLAALCDVADETGSVLVVDESHSLGVVGPHGAGAVVALGLTRRVPFRTASLAKAFIGRAGLVTALDPDFASYFESVAYPAIFSSGLRSHDVAGLSATLEVVRAEDGRRVRLREIAHTVREALAHIGFDMGGVDSHIVALPTGTEADGRAVRAILEAHGVLGAPFCPPATPPGGSLIRLSLHAALTAEQIERIITACERVRAGHGR
ncbi:aminotransferase class I/II-fold pyridoxal phosphate-dependent enzyme [Nocardia sp. BSTN01]|uniref:aminotransferase class I/II-fold pyridoxal phosphate-dependent enzyme n=1 Tax=Nocardia sp. BSTN01 TaxID=2783665 RepID=UPI00188FAE63|nr:aminotransferase class I/II-fold pyridoxal phosphate-dependent enzyme [Nocardia sp. BSTN01]MBF4998040.1 aminotransferase class I/II-fold pyridoxal phosphate-dependent enzyme [Nocardia sp. BSTN01]